MLTKIKPNGDNFYIQFRNVGNVYENLEIELERILPIDNAQDFIFAEWMFGIHNRLGGWDFSE